MREHGLILLLVVALLVTMPVAAVSFSELINGSFQEIGIAHETKTTIKEEVAVCSVDGEKLAVSTAWIEMDSLSYDTATMVHTGLEVTVQPGESRGGILLMQGT